VVKCKTIDIVEVIFSTIWRRNITQMACRNRKTRCALLSPSEAHWSTTTSGCAVFFAHDVPCLIHPHEGTNALCQINPSYARQLLHRTRLLLYGSWLFCP
jgi:hypothetical protein